MIALTVALTLIFILAGISPLLVTDDVRDIVKREHSSCPTETATHRPEEGWVILGPLQSCWHFHHPPTSSSIRTGKGSPCSISSAAFNGN